MTQTGKQLCDVWSSKTTQLVNAEGQVILEPTFGVHVPVSIVDQCLFLLDVEYAWKLYTV